MLSEEEKKAIRNLENLSEFGLSATLNQADLDKMKTVLNLVTKLEKEITKYKNMYEAEHEIHQKRNEQLDRKERGIRKAKQLLLEKDKQIDLMAKAFKQDDVRSIEEIKRYFQELAKEKGE